MSMSNRLKLAMVLLMMLHFGGRPRAQEQVGPASQGIKAFGRTVGTAAAVPTVVSYALGAQDGSFQVSSDVTVTAYTAGTFTTTVAYTDESNTPRVLTLNYSSLAGAISPNIAAAGPFPALDLVIRVKAATTITVATTGTFTTLTYNVEALLRQVN